MEYAAIEQFLASLPDVPETDDTAQSRSPFAGVDVGTMFTNDELLEFLRKPETGSTSINVPDFSTDDLGELEKDSPTKLRLKSPPRATPTLESSTVRELSQEILRDSFRCLMVFELEKPMPTFRHLINFLSEQQWRDMLNVPRVICPPQFPEPHLNFKCGHVYDNKQGFRRFDFTCAVCDFLNILRLVRAFIVRFIYPVLGRMEEIQNRAPTASTVPRSLFETYTTEVPFTDAVHLLALKSGFLTKWQDQYLGFSWRKAFLGPGKRYGSVVCVPWPIHRNRGGALNILRTLPMVTKSQAYEPAVHTDLVKVTSVNRSVTLTRGLMASIFRTESQPQATITQPPIQGEDFFLEVPPEKST